MPNVPYSYEIKLTIGHGQWFLKVVILEETCHMTSALTNQRRVFEACLTRTERVSDDVTHKIGPLDFTCWCH